MATSSPKTARQKSGDLHGLGYVRFERCEHVCTPPQLPRTNPSSWPPVHQAPPTQTRLATHRMVLAGDWKLKPNLKLKSSPPAAAGPPLVRAPFLATGAFFTGPPSPPAPLMSTAIASVEAMGCDMLATVGESRER